MVEAVWGLMGLVRQQLRYPRTGPPQRELLFSGAFGHSPCELLWRERIGLGQRQILYL